MTYHDVEWLKANEDQIPVIVSECDKIMNSELKQSDLPIPVAKNCGGIKSAIASGSFSINPEKIADSLIASTREFLSQ